MKFKRLNLNNLTVFVQFQQSDPEFMTAVPILNQRPTNIPTLLFSTSSTHLMHHIYLLCILCLYFSSTNYLANLNLKQYYSYNLKFITKIVKNYFF